MSSGKHSSTKPAAKIPRLTNNDTDSNALVVSVPTKAALKKKRTPPTPQYPRISQRNAESRRMYDTLEAREIKLNIYMDVKFLRSIGLFGEFEKLLNKVGWFDLLKMNETYFRQLTLEFLSTFNYSAYGFCFHIANEEHKLSNNEVAEMFGWSQEMSKVLVGFVTLFWQDLLKQQTCSYKAQQAYASQIVSPSYRYIHRVLSYTLFGRGGINGSVLHPELEVLYGMHKGVKIEFTLLLADRFKTIVFLTKGPIIVGSFITRIAEKLGIFTRRNTNLEVVKGRDLVDKASCIQMCLVEEVGGKVRLKQHPQHHVEDEAGTSLAIIPQPTSSAHLDSSTDHSTLQHHSERS